MKYFISNYLSQEARDTLKKLHLFTYSLRNSEVNWDEIISIENHVLVNCYGSIVTNKELPLETYYPNNFISYSEFSLENEMVDSLFKLNDNLEDYGILDLSNEEDIKTNFYDLFHTDNNYETLEKISLKSKTIYIIDYYKKLKNFYLVDKGGHIYYLIHVKNSEDNNA